MKAKQDALKPLDELKKEAEELERKIEEDRKIMNDQEASPQKKNGCREAV